MLVTYWIEDQPTPDTVRIVWRDGHTRDFPIPPDETKSNQVIARHSVLFDVSLVFQHDSAEEKELIADSAASVVLIKGGKEIAIRCPIVLKSPDGVSVQRN